MPAERTAHIALAHRNDHEHRESLGTYPTPEAALARLAREVRQHTFTNPTHATILARARTNQELVDLFNEISGESLTPTHYEVIPTLIHD